MLMTKLTVISSANRARLERSFWALYESFRTDTIKFKALFFNEDCVLLDFFAMCIDMLWRNKTCMDDFYVSISTFLKKLKERFSIICTIDRVRYTITIIFRFKHKIHLTAICHLKYHLRAVTCRVDWSLWVHSITRTKHVFEVIIKRNIFELGHINGNTLKIKLN